MAFTDEFNEALLELEDQDLVVQGFTWNGNDYPAFIDGATKGGRLESYGWGIDLDLVIIVRTSAFNGSLPARNDEIIFNGVVYRIDKILTAPRSMFLRLGCVSTNRGA